MLRVKKLHPDAQLPVRAYGRAAGYDVYSIETKVVPVHKDQQEMLEFATLPKPPMTEIRTGISIEIPENCEAQLRCRSSLGKLGIRIHSGTVDPDYKGEITVFMQNLGDKDYVVTKGDRIAQLVIGRFEAMEVLEVENLIPTERGDRGFGSSGK